MSYGKMRSIEPARVPPGMTVVEFLIIVAALAVVITLAVPGSAMLVEQHRVKAASADLFNGLSLARGEAIKRGSTVRVCPSSNGRLCRDDGDWTQGWLVYSDGNGDGTAQDIELIQSFDPPNENVRVIARGATERTAGFTVTGLVPADDAASGEFVLCHANSNRNSRTIRIDAEGWVSLASTPSQACNTG